MKLKLIKIGETFINPALITRIVRIRNRDAAAAGPARFRVWLADANPQDVTTSYGEESELFEAWLNSQCVIDDVTDLDEATKPTPAAQATKGK